MCLSNYGDAVKFTQSFSAENARFLVRKYSPEKLIGSPKAPTLNVVKAAYGSEVVDAVLASHLILAAKCYGVSLTNRSEQIYLVSNMIFTNHSDLKISEIILFFSMLLGGELRDRNDNNAGKMYGNFSGEVIADCLHRFREYRARVLDKIEREEAVKRAGEAIDNPNAISYTEWLKMSGEKVEPLIEMAVGKVDTSQLNPEQLPQPEVKELPKPKNMANLMTKFLTLEQIKRLKEGTLDPNDYIEDVEPLEDEPEEQSIPKEVHEPTTDYNEQYY